jgi:hypothetical protein
MDKETIKQRSQCALHFQKLDDAIVSTKEAIARIDGNLANHIGDIKMAIKDLDAKFDIQAEKQEQDSKLTYATKEEISPLKRIVYGAVGFILLTVLSAIIYEVVTK